MNKKLLFIVFILITSVLKAQFIQSSVNSNSDIQSISCDKNMVFALASNQVFKSSDYGVSYSLMNTIPSMHTFSLVKYSDTNNTLYLATKGNPVISTTATLLKSIDGGLTWNTVSIPSFNSTIIGVMKIKGQKIILGTNYDGVLVSNDGGVTWNTKTNGLPKFYGDTTLYEEITEIEETNGDLFVGTHRNGVFKLASGDSVFQEMNSGVSKNPSGLYSQVSDIYHYNGRYFRGLVNDSYYFSDNDMVSHTYFTEFFASNGFGITFTSYSNVLYSAVENYVYYSTDNGTTWKRLNDYFSSGINRIVANGNNILVGTKAEGLWVMQMNTAGINEVAFNANLNVYPNPATNFVNIDLTSQSNQTDFGFYVEIMSSNGEIIEVLEASSGQTVQLDVTHFPKGAYLVRLSNLNRTYYTTKKILVN